MFAYDWLKTTHHTPSTHTPHFLSPSFFTSHTNLCFDNLPSKRFGESATGVVQQLVGEREKEGKEEKRDKERGKLIFWGGFLERGVDMGGEGEREGKRGKERPGEKREIPSSSLQLSKKRATAFPSFVQFTFELSESGFELCVCG